ncbi:MAG TPA: plastocyanin/azurin family copper-binding protein [Mycobacteriales bacterium]|nr:plastocyanin/azurin family copper-binding protein [Mycobacteriales bacterium]
MRRSLSSAALLVGTLCATGLLGAPAASAGGGCSDDVSFRPDTTKVVTEHACWAPTVTQVRPGQAVSFVNASGMEHNITGPGPIGFHDLGLAAGSTVKITFPSAGIYPYACTFHPGMSGAVVVGNPLGDAVPAADATGPEESGAATPAVSLSTTDADDGSSLLSSTPAAVGAGVAAAGVLGAAGVLVTRRRRAALPLT